jgi:hypothetical protein
LALTHSFQFTGKFDVVVFMPPQMPAFPAMTDEPAAEGVSVPRRVYPEYVSQVLSCHIANVVALGIANAGYWPPPDSHLIAIETDLRRLREMYNRIALHGFKLEV